MSEDECIIIIIVIVANEPCEKFLLRRHRALHARREREETRGGFPDHTGPENNQRYFEINI
jgi:hypothetical protein